MRVFHNCILVLIFLLIGCGSITPIATSYQSAKIYTDSWELTPTYTAVNHLGTDTTGIESHNIGFQMTKGYQQKPFFLSKPITGCNLVRFELSYPRNAFHNDTATIFFDIEPKISLIKDKLAIGNSFGSYLNVSKFAYYVHLDLITLHYTESIADILDLSFSGRFISTTGHDGVLGYIGLNAGVGIGSVNAGFVLRPVIGYLYGFRGNMQRITFGAGLNIYVK